MLVVGLDCAGKTTMVYSLSKQVKFSMPTLGFTVEEVEVKTRMNLAVWRRVGNWEVGARSRKPFLPAEPCRQAQRST